MKIPLDKSSTQKVQQMSSIMKIDQRTIVKRAIASYVNSLKGEVALERELRAGDRLSDEALFNFERQLQDD